MTDVPKIVVSRLAGRNSQVGQPDSHPNANLLSAFAEQALGNADRLQVLEHLAHCCECREIVWLAAPQVEAANVVSAKASAPWLSWPVLRWGAAAACVVIVGAAVTLHKWETHPAPSLAKISTQVSDLAAASSPQAGAAVARLDSAASPAAARPAAPVSNAPATRTLMELKPAPMAKPHMRAAAPQAEPSQPNADETTDLVAENEIDTLVPGRAKDASEEAQAPTSNLAPASGMALAGQSQAMNAKSLLVPASSLAPRWTLTSDGTLQRSLDLGRTWERITVAAGASLRALAANGLDIWVGGTAGALYHSADAGHHWMQVRPVCNGQQLTADIIGVEFPDAQNGRLNTSSGEVWTTTDAGSSWEKQ